MSSIKERADSLITDKEKYLQDAIKAKELIKFLPEEIQNLNGEADYFSYGEGKDLHEWLYVEINDWGQKQNAVNVLRMCGVQGLKRQVSYGKMVVADGGECILPNGMTARFKVYDAGLSPSCILEEYQTTAYRLKCLDSSKEES